MIQYNHEQHHVGYYPTAEEAARAYDRKALLFMGPSAITNFPPSDYAGEDLTAEGTAEEQVPHPDPMLLASCCVGNTTSVPKSRRTVQYLGMFRAFSALAIAHEVIRDLGSSLQQKGVI